MEDGKPFGDGTLNAYYWAFMKSGRTYKTETGFRMWNRAFHTEPVIEKSAGTFVYSASDWSADISEYQWPEGEGPVIDESLIKGDKGGSDSGKTKEELEKELDELADDAVEVAEGLGMAIIIIIIISVACCLIMTVAIIFCIVRASRNKNKTPVQLKEGGEAEMQEITLE